jgi:hypothetical protein
VPHFFCFVGFVLESPTRQLLLGRTRTPKDGKARSPFLQSYLGTVILKINDGLGFRQQLPTCFCVLRRRPFPRRFVFSKEWRIECNVMISCQAKSAARSSHDSSSFEKGSKASSTSNHNHSLKLLPLQPLHRPLQLGIAPLIRQVTCVDQNIARRQFRRLIVRVRYTDYASLAPCRHT